MGRPGSSPLPLQREPQRRPDPLPRPPVRRLANAPGSLSYRHPPVTLQIETEPSSGEFAPAQWLDWQRLYRARDGGDTTLTLRAVPNAGDLDDPGSVGARHLKHLLDLLSPDRRVRVAQMSAGFSAAVYFQGYPMAPALSWSAGGQAVTCVCVDEGQEVLRTSEATQITGRRMRLDPLAEWDSARPNDVEVRALSAVFNPGNLPNRTATAYPFSVEGEMYRVHLFTDDNAPGATYWSVADAIRYVALQYMVRPRIRVSAIELMYDTLGLIGMGPSPASPDPLVRLMSQPVADLSVTSMNVEEALAALCTSAGLHYEVAVRNGGDYKTVEAEHYLRVFATLASATDAAHTPQRLMGQPGIYDIPREAPFTTMTGRSPLDIALANRAVAVNLTIDKRAISGPIVLGGVHEYEGTFLMRPGWAPLAETLDYPGPPETGEGGEPITEEEAAEHRAVWEAAALAYWEEEFDPEFEVDEDGESTGVPRSIYHPGHPNHHAVSDVGRLWVFPDDHRMITAHGTSPYARYDWAAELYSPYDPADPERLVLSRSDIGGGIRETSNWVPRRRPMRETIGRRRDTGDRSPVVRLNFNASDPYTALDRTDWVTYGGKP
ncbi:MAG TPA: hypothetical protein VM389_00175, partial [Phycisphaerae bacterium]|nr:hypothetical protein [Phycisphaerae bacterium]